MEGAAAGLDAGQMAMWRSLLASNFFGIPPTECPTCGNPKKPCGTFFCVACNMGNVCPAAFLDGGAHAQHPRIRVWMVTRQFSVCIDDVRRFMPGPVADQLQLYRQNTRLNVKLVKPDPDSQSSVARPRSRICHGSCNDVISMSSIPNHSEHPVCSLKCLLDYLDAQAAVVMPRPAAAVLPVAGPLVMGGAGDEGEQARADVQGGDHERRHRRKQDKASITRSHLS